MTAMPDLDWTLQGDHYAATRDGHTYTCHARRVRASDGGGCVQWETRWTLRRDGVVIDRDAPDPTRARSHA